MAVHYSKLLFITLEPQIILRMLFRLFLCTATLLLLRFSVSGETADALFHADSELQFYRSHGIHPFGPKHLKYQDASGLYPSANPAAPQGGEVRIGWPAAYTKKNRLSIGGADMPGNWLPLEPMAEISYDNEDMLSAYGLLAEWFDIAEDGLSMLIKVRPEARFSDGKPVTADDVVFSWDITADPGYTPSTRLALQDVEGVEKVDELTVKVHFKRKMRDLPYNFVTAFYVIPKHIYGRPGTDFGKDFNDMPSIGTGPYLLEREEFGAYVTWKRNPNYWGKELWLNKGRYNVERLTFKIYLEPRAQREALKADEIDLMDVASAQDWNLDLDSAKLPAIANHWLIKQNLPSTRIPNVQCFAFNLRRTVFQDIRVRKAIASLFDFETANTNLFFGMYTRQYRFFESPKMRAEEPAEGREWDYLLDLRRRYNDPNSGVVYVPKEALTTGPRQMGSDLSGKMLPIDDRIQMAGAYLDDAGWFYDKKKKVRMKEGIPLQFEILLLGDGFQRVVNPFFDTLARVGIRTAYKSAQLPEHQDRMDKYDYDMAVTTFFIYPCPGIEQFSYWNSAGADIKAGDNICGVKNPAVDEVIQQMMTAPNPEDVYFYTRILDRILWSNYYMVPQWYSPEYKAVYWNRFGQNGVYFGRAGLTWNSYQFWWIDPDKDSALKSARKTGKPLPPETVPVILKENKP